MFKPVKNHAGASGDSWILATIIVVMAFGCLCVAALFVFGSQFTFSGMTFTGEQSQKKETGEIGESVEIVEIINRHGNISVSHQSELGWNWELTAWADSVEKADELRDQIKMEVTQSNGKQTWELVLPDDQSECNGVKSNLVLHVPRSVKAIVRNLHGETSISDVSDGIFINSEHGDIDCRSCPCAVEIQSRHGDVVLKEFRGLKIDSRHGELSVDSSSAAVTIDAQHVDIRASDIDGDLTAKSVHGDITASGIRGNVAIENRHGEIDLDCFAESVKCSNEHDDTTVRIGNQSVRKIAIRGRHSDIDLSLPSSLRPKLSTNAKHGDVRNELEFSDAGEAVVEVSTIHGDIRIRKHDVVEAESSATVEAESN